MTAYLKKTQLEEIYGISLCTVNDRIKRIRPLVGKRYPLDSIISTGRFVRVRGDVFKDMMLYKDLIEYGAAPKFHE